MILDVIVYGLAILGALGVFLLVLLLLASLVALFGQSRTQNNDWPMPNVDNGDNGDNDK
jgi:hypothetical protein